MHTLMKKIIKSMILLPLIGYGLAQAATRFVPDDAYITGYVGSPTASGFNLRADRVMYTIDYSSQDWSGNLHAYNVNTNGITSTTDNWVTVDGLTTKYGAAPKIDAQAAGAGYNNNRKIVTKSDTGGIPFLWGSLSTAQKNLVDPGTANTATNSPVLDYIRGDRQNEAPAVLDYSKRNTVLGDIIHATPKYWDDGTNTTVYVGANDGMLHAIDAVNGTERFAYIPSMLLPKLNALKDADYTHKYYVDGQLAIATFDDATLNSGASATVTDASTFTSILVGGLGAGGKGIFALDVSTVPTSESDAASKVMWEVSNASANFTSLGDTYGKPVFATLQDGTPALVMANGYNNTGNGHAYLYIINPKTGALIKAMDTGSGSKSNPNGLSSPTLVDTNFDGKVDHAYAGDIDGKLWKFNLATTAGRAQAPVLMHTTNPAQAITMAPSYKSHPDGGYIVTFVTGKIFVAADKTNNATHYAYGIWDGAPAGNTDILDQTLIESNYTFTNSAGVAKTIKVRTSSKNQPNWAAEVTGEAADKKHHKGWKTALPVGGERVVGDGANISDAQFIFLSTNPTVDADALPPGENWFMQLNALTGGNNTDIRFDLNADSSFTTTDKVSVTNILTGNTTTENPVGRNIGGGVRSQFVVFATNNLDIYIASYDKNGAPITPDNATAPDPTVVQIASTTLAPYITVNTPADSTSSTIVYSTTGSTSSTNTETTTVVGAPIITNGSGVAGGHFDEDIYYGPATLNKGVLTYAKKLHHHEYDDTYDKTGVNMLAASDSGFNLSKAIPLTTTQFKVLVQNQYLNPAVSIHLNGSPFYVYNLDQGYIPIKNYTTSSTLNVSSLPTYTRATVNSLAINMPTDAFAQKDWWNTGVAPNNALPADVRVGLHPTVTGCVNKSAGGTDGNMYQPVLPPGTEASFGLPANSIPAYGKLGYSTTTTSLTAKGVRHNGSLVVQVIAAATPQSELEMTVPNRPEFGWRVKAAYHDSRVLAEYSTFWHHPNGKCYGAVDWTKLAPQDSNSSSPSGTPATGSSDPKIGGFAVSSGGAVILPKVGTTVGTPVVNADGSISTPTTVVTLLSNGSYSSVTSITTVPPTQTAGTNNAVVTNPDGSVTTTTTTITANNLGGYTTKVDINTVGATGVPPAVGTVVSAPVTNTNGSVTTTTTVTVKNANGTYTATATANTTAYDTVITNPALVGDTPAAVAGRAAIAEAVLIAAEGSTGKCYPPVTNTDETITVTRKNAVLLTAATTNDPALVGTYVISGTETTYPKGTVISATCVITTSTPTTGTTGTTGTR